MAGEVETWVTVRRGYVRFHRLEAKLNDEDRAELTQRLEAFHALVEDAAAWAESRDPALARALSWIEFLSKQLVLNGGHYDPDRHQICLAVIRYGMGEARADVEEAQAARAFALRPKAGRKAS
jgi:hypothetical protein